MRRIILWSPVSDDMRHYLAAGGARGLFLPPVGLLLVAQELERAGFAVTLVDGNFDLDYLPRLVQQAAAQREELVFIGAYLALLQLKDFRQAATALRAAAPGVPVVVGGPFPSVFTAAAAGSPLIDICCTGDGARVAVALAGHLAAGRDWRSLPNLAYADSGQVVTTPREWFDELTGDNVVQYERFFPVDEYAPHFSLYLPPRDGWQRALPLLTGLGCSYKCAFCENAVLGHKHRSLPAEAIVERMRHYHERYGIEAFALFDEDFFIDRARLLRFIELLEAARLPVRWGTQCRVNYFRDGYIDRELLRRLAAVGCVRLSMGVESGSPAMLKLLRKQITPEQVLAAADTGSDSPIVFTFSLMIGLPGETRADLFATLDLMLQAMQRKPNCHVSAVHPYWAFPGTPLARLAEERGGYSAQGLSLDELADLSLEEYNRRILGTSDDAARMPVQHFLTVMTMPAQYRYYRHLFRLLAWCVQQRRRRGWYTGLADLYLLYRGKQAWHYLHKQAVPALKQAVRRLLRGERKEGV